MLTTDGYLTVSEAAKFLSVAPNTLRNWGRDGKITEHRHPINNYRLFKVDDLKKLQERLSDPPVKRPK